MTQAEIIKDIAKKTGLKVNDVKDVVVFYQNAMIDELVADGKLTINKFGSFTVKQREAKQGRNPRTGETIEIAAHKSVTFKAASYLNDNIQ